MTKNPWLAAAATALLLSLTTACGGDGGRPSVDEVSDGLQKNMSDVEISEELADCMAKVFHESDLSDEALRAVADGDDDFDATGKDEEAGEAVLYGEELAACTKKEAERLQ